MDTSGIETPKAPKLPRITKVSFGLTVNTGNYETVRFDLTAEVLPDEDWRTVMNNLRGRCERLKKEILSTPAPA